MEQNISVLVFVLVFVPRETLINKGINTYIEQKNKNITKKVIMII
jgi:hypothetical protein